MSIEPCTRALPAQLVRARPTRSDPERQRGERRTLLIWPEVIIAEDGRNSNFGFRHQIDSRTMIGEDRVYSGSLHKLESANWPTSPPTESPAWFPVPTL